MQHEIVIALVSCRDAIGGIEKRDVDPIASIPSPFLSNGGNMSPKVCDDCLCAYRAAQIDVVQIDRRGIQIGELVGVDVGISYLGFVTHHDVGILAIHIAWLRTVEPHLTPNGACSKYEQECNCCSICTRGMHG